MSISSRRRALMGAAAVEGPNGLKPGTGYGRGGATDVSVNDSGKLTITYLQAAWANRAQIPLIRKAAISEGDTVRFVIKKDSGAGNDTYCSLYLGGAEIYSNELIRFQSHDCFDKTITASNSWSFQYIIIQARSGNISNPGVYTIQIYQNGEALFE